MKYKKKINKNSVNTMYKNLTNSLIEDFQRKGEKIDSLYKNQIINTTQQSKIDKINVDVKVIIEELIEDKIIALTYITDINTTKLIYEFVENEKGCYFIVEENNFSNSKKVNANNFFVQYVWKLSFNKKYKYITRVLGG